MHFTTLIWVNKHENALKRNACGGHVGFYCKDTQMATKTRKCLAIHNFCYGVFGFALNQLKVIYEYFPGL